eukprot:COSAG01_NODE_17055_length_1182_cov_1.341644_3_plen_24_part_01
MLDDDGPGLDEVRARLVEIYAQHR